MCFKIVGVCFLYIKNIGVFFLHHLHPVGRVGGDVDFGWFLLGKSGNGGEKQQREQKGVGFHLVDFFKKRPKVKKARVFFGVFRR
jgi:hypothetical protein